MVTIGMKNLMGVVWDRWYWHRNDLTNALRTLHPFANRILLWWMPTTS